ncbi:MAG: hypothetical protein RRA15_01975 [bacterium]|nr:hypothetical protein [bacterium]MDT8365247.1 hypothetical protein [bacterium]
MTKKLLLIMILLLALVLSPAPSFAGSAMDSLIDRVLFAYGGKKLDSVNAYRMEGAVAARMRQTEGSMVRLFSRPDRLYVDLAYKTNPERRFLDRERGWRTDPGGDGINEVGGHLLKSMVLQAARSNIPWVLSERRDDVTQIPPLKIEDRMTIGLQVLLEPGLFLRLYADPKTARIVYSQAILNTESLKTHFETAYSEFREVDGVLFAFHEENWASGFNTGMTEIRKITVNPATKPEDFRP